jgi:hypothetical protein
VCVCATACVVQQEQGPDLSVWVGGWVGVGGS